MAPLSLARGSHHIRLLSSVLFVVFLAVVATTVAAHEADTIDHIARLNDWARDHLTSSHHLHVDASRHVVAAGDIKEKETVLFVGKQYWLDDAYVAKLGHRDRIVAALETHKFSESRDGNASQLAAAAVVAFQLLLEKIDPASKWRAYIDALPQHIGLPLSYSAADFELLRGSPVYDNTIKSKHTLRAQWTLVHPILKEVSQHEFTADDWTWAMSVVISRAFAHRAGWTLVPVADMLDHHSEPSVSYSFSNEGLALVATRNIAENEHVFGSYGKGSNAHFLQQFGFAFPNNDADTLTVSMTSSYCPFERFFANQAKLSQAALEDMVDEYSAGAGGSLKFVLNSNPKSLDGLNAFARAMTRGDRIGGTRAPPREHQPGELLDTERDSTTAVASLLRCLIAAYPTTLSTDLREMSKVQESRNDNNDNNSNSSDVSYYRLALVSGEKQILHKHLEALEERLSRWARRDKRPRRTRPPTSAEL